MRMFSMLPFNTTNRKNSYQKLQKRSLRLESLEERQLLTVAMDMALGAADAFSSDTGNNDTVYVSFGSADTGVNTDIGNAGTEGTDGTPLEGPGDSNWSSSNEFPSTIVTTSNDTTSATSNTISLREAATVYANKHFQWGHGENRHSVNCGPTVTFSSSLETPSHVVSMSLGSSLTVPTGVTLQAAANQTVTITLAADATFSGTLSAGTDGWIDVKNSTGKVVASSDPSHLVETASTVVTITDDTTDTDQDSGISLREATTVYAESGDTVTFDADLEDASGDIALSLDSSLTVPTGVTLQAAAGQHVTITLAEGATFSGALAAVGTGRIDIVQNGVIIDSTYTEPALITVNQLTDAPANQYDDLYTLRDAINNAKNSNTITFAAGLTTDANTILLGGVLDLDGKSLTIDAGTQTINIQESAANAGWFNGGVTLTADEGGEINLLYADGTVAFSTAWETPTTAVTTTESTVDKTDGKISLAEAILYAGTTWFNPATNAEVTVGTTINLTADDLGALEEGQTDYVFQIDSPIALNDATTINADGISVVLQLVDDGDFLETETAILSLTTTNGGRVRFMDNNDNTLYDSAWEFRGMGDQTVINVTNDQIDEFDADDGELSLREAISYIGKSYREYADGNETVTLSSNLAFDAELTGEAFTLESYLSLNEPIILDGNGITFNMMQTVAGEEEGEYSEYYYGLSVYSTVELSNINFVNGSFNINNEAQLSIDNVSFSDLTLTNFAQTTLDGAVFNGAFVQNYNSLTLQNATFSGVYDLNKYQGQNQVVNLNGDYNANVQLAYAGDIAVMGQNSAIVNNYNGEMFLEGCIFVNIDMNYDISQYENYDEQGINGSFAVVSNNNGDLLVKKSLFTGNTLDLNAVHGDIFAKFALVNTQGSGDRGEGLTIVTQTAICGNAAKAYSKHGDVSVEIAAINDYNAQLVVFSSIIYGQTASADSKYGAVGMNGEEILSSGATGINAETEDILLLNSTILDTIALNRSEAVVLNTIYNETSFVRSGFAFDDVEGNNLCLVGYDWSTLFPFWNAETNSFDNYDYRIYADNQDVVDAGNNNFLTVEYLAGLFQEELDESEVGALLLADLLGNDRIINEIVDIGAVESNAVRLNEQSLAPEAKAQKDEPGLTTIDFSWGSDAIESALVTFHVRYRLAATETTEAGAWTTLEGVGQENLPAGVTFNAETNRYTWSVDGLNAGRTLYDFEVFGIGDRIDYLDSSDWVSANETTREQIWTPEFPQAAPQSETAITITWVTDPRAVAYEIVYALNDDPDNTTTLLVQPGAGGVTIQEKTIAGETVFGAAYTITGLEEGKGYTIQWRALSEYGYSTILNAADASVEITGDDYLLNSEWVTKSTSTKTVLSAPEISNEFANTLSSLEISWSTGDQGTSSYTVEMGTVNPTNNEWTTTRTFTTTNTSLLVDQLNAATEYSFRVKATGNSQFYVDSDWSEIKSFSTLIQLDAPELTADSVFTTEWTTDTLRVDWTAPEEATTSTLYMSTDGGSNYLELTADNFSALTITTDSGSVVIAGLDAGTEYFFKLVCSADAKVYAPSSATTSAVTPTAVDAPVLSWTDNGDGTANITWDSVANATEYVVNNNAQDETQFTTGAIATDVASSFDVFVRGDQANNYASSASDTLTLQRLEAPTDLAAVTPEDGTTKINVSWTAVENDWVSGYKVQYLVGNDWVDAGTTTAEVTSLEVSSLTPGTQYYFRVQTLSESGNAGGMLISEYSADRVSATTLEAPYAPTEISADATGLHQVNLSWTEADQADGTYWYVIDAYLASDDSKVATQGADKSITGGEFVFTGLNEDTTYYFTITAFSSDPRYLGGSQAVESNEDTTWIQLVAPNLSVADAGVGLDSVTLNWTDANAVADVANYKITYGSTTITVDAGTYSTTIEGLNQGTEHTFTIQAIGIEDRSVDSLPDTEGLTDSVTVTTWAELGEPASVTAVADSTTTITVTWEAVENAAFGYSVTCDTLPEGAAITVDSENLTATATGLTPNTEYTFTVTANAGTDADSGITYVKGGELSDSATTWQKLSIDSLSATVNGTTITLNWDIPAGDEGFVQGYTVQYLLDGVWTTLVGEESGTDKTLTFTGVPSTAYSFRVMANSNQGDDGDSAWKETADVTTWDKLLVENLDAVAAGTQVINVSWDKINVDGVVYRLFMASGNQNDYPGTGVLWTEIDLTNLNTEGDSCSIAVSGLTAETEYTFVVLATAADNIDSDPALDSATTWAVTPLVDELVITATASGQTITVDWDAVPGAVSYTVDYKWTNIAGVDQTGSKTVTTDLAQFNGLEPGVMYTFTVTATPAASDVDHSVAVSNEASATTDALKLNTPNGSAVANNSGLSVHWDANANATGYTILWRAQGAEGDWNSQDVLGNVTSFTIDNVVASTAYDIQIIALGDGTHYTDSDAAQLTCNALIAVNLDAVVVLEKSESTATVKPVSVAEIDEWTPAYLELWTSDIEGLVSGRELTATFVLNDNYEAASVLDLPGTTVTIDGNTINITIDSNYSGTGDAVVAQILLTPKSQANGNASQNGIGVEDASEKLVQYNDVWITDIRPVIYDLNDDGVIDGIDEAIYAVYTKKDADFVDYNNDGKNCDDDLRMLTRNQGKSQAGNWHVDYSIIACTCSEVTPVAAPALASGFVSTMYVKEESEVTITEASSEFSIELAKMEKDLMPYQQEENRMTDGTILKKTTTDKDTNVKADDSDSANADVNLDDFWADERNADWRFA